MPDRDCLLRWLILCCLTLGFLVCPQGVGAQEKRLSFGVVPQQSASKLVRTWTPLLRSLADKTGYDLVFKTAPSIVEFEQQLATGHYDLAYMNPYHYTVFSESSGYRAFAKQKDVRLQGILVVHQDSPYQTVYDLAWAELAFPSPAAFAATILPLAHLKKSNTQIIPKYVNSHDSVYLSVAMGLFPAGGGVVRTLDNTEAVIRSQLRILWTSDPYTPHAFAAHPRLGSPITDTIQKAMVDMNDDPAALVLLENLNFKGFAKARHQDWDDVRALHISELEDFIKK